MASLYACPPSPSPPPSPSRSSIAATAKPITAPVPGVQTLPDSLLDSFLKPTGDQVVTLLAITVLTAYSATMSYQIWCAGRKEDEWGPGHFGMKHSFAPLAESIGAYVGWGVGRVLDAMRVGYFWVVGGFWWLNVVYAAAFICYHLIVRPFISVRKEIVDLSPRMTRPQRVAAHATLHSIVAVLVNYTIRNVTIPYPTLWGWIKYIKLDHPLLQYIVYGTFAIGFFLGACDLAVVELAMLPLTLPIRVVFPYLSHILNVKNYDEDSIGLLVILSAMWTFFAWAAWIVWNDGSRNDWGRGHFGLQFSFVRVSELIGKGIGKIIGCMIDAGWVGGLWVLAGAWWLHMVFVSLFVINNLIVQPLVYIRKVIGGVFAEDAVPGTDRFIAHAPLHAIFALLFHYTIWNRTIPYPTIWGWINYIKLDQIILRYSVNGSLAVGFILGACNLTTIELAMLPITLSIRIIENGKRMENERQVRILARRCLGVNTEAKREKEQ
ncbi:hypothetical protein RQP46_008208 [Phenoliferia psychrophenolica]